MYRLRLRSNTESGTVPHPRTEPAMQAAGVEAEQVATITIKHRHTGAVLYAHETTEDRIGIGLAMKDATDAALKAGADLRGADLSGAHLREDITLNREPIQISGLRWHVYILDSHMQIGCELHSLDEWRGFDDARIVQMDGRDALRFWRAHKDALLSLAASDGRGIATAAEAA